MWTNFSGLSENIEFLQIDCTCTYTIFILLKMNACYEFNFVTYNNLQDGAISHVISL